MTSQPDASLLEQLRRYDTPTLANAIETFAVRPQDSGYTRGHVHPIFPDQGTLVGFAATASIRASGAVAFEKDADKYADLYAHVHATPGPTVIVLHDEDFPEQVGSMWGEVNAAVFKAIGAIGSITDGTVRDIDEVRPTGFAFFATNIGVSHGYVRLQSVGEPVAIDGLPVSPSELVVADKYGVLTIPDSIAEHLPAAADRVNAREQEFIAWVKSPEYSFEKLAQTRIQH